MGIAQDIPEGFEAEHHGCRDYVLRPRDSRQIERRPVADLPGRRQRKKLRPGRRSDPSRRPGGVVHVREHVSPSWFTPAGVHAKLKLLEAKGLPDFGGWRFITLSCDQEYFGCCPLTAFLAGRDHMRRFLDKCREAGLWNDDAKWCWKLEFQRNGWPHWHLLVDRRRKFSYAEMRLIDQFWGMGRTNCRRISKNQKFGYLFKYVFKGVYQEDGDGSLSVPQWFLEFTGETDVVVTWKENGVLLSQEAVKPTSFARVRFWQTCKGFYTGKPVKPRDDEEVFSCIVPRPVAFIVDDRRASYVVVARNGAGKYRKSSLVRMSVDRREFIRRHLWDVDNGVALVLSTSSFVMAPDTLNRILTESDKWKLQQTLKENRLSLGRAQILRHERKDLATY